jgi:hypothetical protein
MPVILLGPGDMASGRISAGPIVQAPPRGAASAIRRMSGMPLPFLAAGAVQPAVDRAASPKIA